MISFKTKSTNATLADVIYVTMSTEFLSAREGKDNEMILTLIMGIVSSTIGMVFPLVSAVQRAKK